MPGYILFEDDSHFALRPFTFTRPVFHLRSGILTIIEKWKYALEQSVYALPMAHLKEIFQNLPQDDGDQLWVNGKICPDSELIAALEELPPNTYMANLEGEIVMARFPIKSLPHDFRGCLSEAILEEIGLHKQLYTADFLAIRFMPDIFRKNHELIIRDFALISQKENSVKLTDPYTRVYGKDNLFISEGAQIRSAIINAENGPVYIGKNAIISEGSIILNTHAICAHSKVQPGAKLRGDTTIGPKSKIGGEVGNSVIMGNSNKGHEGYLGNSVLGYWCNLGADTNTSNLKNNYANVKIWHYPSERFRDTGQQFCGLMMGDHSKAGINTMFNTGTVVGVSANIYGSGFPRVFIPSFSWGGASGFKTYRINKAFETMERVMPRKNSQLTEEDKRLFQHIFEETASYRVWDRKIEA
ncbi:MAG: putative sugar nucleotidyl transferase [Bacteroidota bacterium]